MKSVIRVKDVSKKYNEQYALQNVSLELPEHQTHIFLGSSGSGKSTLLKCIMGLKEFDSGSIEIDSDQVTSPLNSEMTRKIGYLPQEGRLFPHLNIRANVTLAAKLAGWQEKAMNSRVEELGEIVGFESEWWDRFPRQLSGGQRQRAALVRALFQDPKILLLDEPLGALDPLIRARLQEDLKIIFSRLKKLVILVTHDLGEASFFGDSITLFHEGKMVQHGQFREFIDSPQSQFVKDFVGAQRLIFQERMT
ncbi:MAG: ATP-binding cassette domain-containing protein [Bdellovibrionales bacterium]